jgi:hypothetical protein
MRTVRDGDGTRYLLVKRSGSSSLCRDPRTGQERYLPNDDLTVESGASPLSVAASGVPESVRRVLTTVHSDAGLGLLVTLVDRGPTPVRTLLDVGDLCESDLHGLIAEFRAAGLVTETTVAGERGYESTATATEAIERLRPAAAGQDSGDATPADGANDEDAGNDGRSSGDEPTAPDR